jgi:hypothetical protein
MRWNVQNLIQEVTFAWDFLQARRKQLWRLTGDRFQREVTCFWRVACYRVLGSLRKGEQRSIRQQLADHLDRIAHPLQQGNLQQAIALLASVQISSRRGQCRGQAISRMPALLPRVRALAPLLTTDDAWIGLEIFWMRVLDQALTRLAAGQQQALLDQLGIHLAWICDRIRRRKTSAWFISGSLPRPVFTSQQGHYTRKPTLRTFDVPDGWSPAIKTRSKQLEPETIIWRFPFVSYPAFPPLCPDFPPEVLALGDPWALAQIVVQPGKRQQWLPLRGLADEYDRIMDLLTPMLSSTEAQEGWETLEDATAQHVRAQLQTAFCPIDEGRWRTIMNNARVRHPDAPGWWCLGQEKLALAILSELYQTAPGYLKTTFLPWARRLQKPWPEQKAWLFEHFQRKYLDRA